MSVPLHVVLLAISLTAFCDGEELGEPLDSMKHPDFTKKSIFVEKIDKEDPRMRETLLKSGVEGRKRFIDRLRERLVPDNGRVMEIMKRLGLEKDSLSGKEMNRVEVDIPRNKPDDMIAKMDPKAAIEEQDRFVLKEKKGSHVELSPEEFEMWKRWRAGSYPFEPSTKEALRKMLGAENSNPTDIIKHLAQMEKTRSKEKGSERENFVVEGKKGSHVELSPEEFEMWKRWRAGSYPFETATKEALRKMLGTENSNSNNIKPFGQMEEKNRSKKFKESAHARETDWVAVGDVLLQHTPARLATWSREKLKELMQETARHAHKLRHVLCSRQQCLYGGVCVWVNPEKLSGFYRPNIIQEAKLLAANIDGPNAQSILMKYDAVVRAAFDSNFVHTTAGPSADVAVEEEIQPDSVPRCTAEEILLFAAARELIRVAKEAMKQANGNFVTGFVRCRCTEGFAGPHCEKCIDPKEIKMEGLVHHHAP